MPDNLLGRIGDFLHGRRPWYELPRVLSLPMLVEIRNQLRRENLLDTEEPPLEQKSPPADLDPATRNERTVDGSNNDLKFPAMGSCGRRFGRNVPLEHTFPDTANLMTPNPRVVSRELMTREEFQPATILNLLAAAWIQFMVHDWFVHKRSPIEDGVEIPLAPGDDWADGRMKIPRSVPEPAPAGSTRPPAYANSNSHWWDGSQIYGSDAVVAAALRTGQGGKLRLEATKLLPVDPETGVHLSGFTDNWWIGLAMLHTIFTQEHNHICDLLARDHPDWNDARLHGTAKLINSALMAKVHTTEWTPAIVPHPTIEYAMNGVWNGLAGTELQEIFEFLDDNEVLGGIIGSTAEHHAAPYSLTEEFISVYRMHPLIPDQVLFRSLRNDAELETIELPDMAGRKTPAVANRIGMSDLFYSFGRAHPGAITLHNFPKHLQDLTRDDGEHLDLAAVDIFRDRERGVPRYNQFRRLIHKEPVQLVRRADEQSGVARADSDGLRERFGEGGPDDRAVRGTAARRLRVQRNGVPHIPADGHQAAEERSVLHRRLSPGGVHPVRGGLRSRQRHAVGAEAPPPGTGAGARGCDQRVQAVAFRSKHA